MVGFSLELPLLLPGQRGGQPSAQLRPGVEGQAVMWGGDLSPGQGGVVPQDHPNAGLCSWKSFCARLQHVELQLQMSRSPPFSQLPGAARGSDPRCCQPPCEPQPVRPCQEGGKGVLASAGRSWLPAWRAPLSLPARRQRPRMRPPSLRRQLEEGKRTTPVRRASTWDFFFFAKLNSLFSCR